MTVFFISAITFADNLLAFCLHSLPSTVTVVMLGEFSNIVMLLFTIQFLLAPLDAKAQQGFHYRLSETPKRRARKFSDLSMIDPLTGFYNRRGLHNSLEGLLGAGGDPGLPLFAIARYRPFQGV